MLVPRRIASGFFCGIVLLYIQNLVVVARWNPIFPPDYLAILYLYCFSIPVYAIFMPIHFWFISFSLLLTTGPFLTLSIQSFASFRDKKRWHTSLLSNILWGGLSDSHRLSYWYLLHEQLQLFLFCLLPNIKNFPLPNIKNLQKLCLCLIGV